MQFPFPPYRGGLAHWDAGKFPGGPLSKWGFFSIFLNRSLDIEKDRAIVLWALSLARVQLPSILEWSHYDSKHNNILIQCPWASWEKFPRLEHLDELRRNGIPRQSLEQVGRLTGLNSMDLCSTFNNDFPLLSKTLQEEFSKEHTEFESLTSRCRWRY